MDDKTKGALAIGAIAAAGLLLPGRQDTVIVPVPPAPIPIPDPTVLTSVKTGMKWSVAVSPTNKSQYILTIISLGSLVAATDTITPLFVAYSGPNLTGTVLALKDVGHDQTPVKVGDLIITPPATPNRQSAAIRLDIRRRGFTDAGHNTPGIIATPAIRTDVPGSLDPGLITQVPVLP